MTKLQCTKCNKITYHSKQYGSRKWGMIVYECMNRSQFDFPCQNKTEVKYGV